MAYAYEDSKVKFVPNRAPQASATRTPVQQSRPPVQQTSRRSDEGEDDAYWSSSHNSTATTTTQRVDITETDSAIEFKAEAPGFGPEDVSVEVHEGVLTISAKRVQVTDQRDSSGRVIRTEKRSKQFTRSFGLPESARPEAVTAVLEAGILHVHVPKRVSAAAAVRIPVKVGGARRTSAGYQ